MLIALQDCLFGLVHFFLCIQTVRLLYVQSSLRTHKSVLLSKTTAFVCGSLWFFVSSITTQLATAQQGCVLHHVLAVVEEGRRAIPALLKPTDGIWSQHSLNATINICGSRIAIFIKKNGKCMSSCQYLCMMEVLTVTLTAVWCLVAFIQRSTLQPCGLKCSSTQSVAEHECSECA